MVPDRAPSVENVKYRGLSWTQAVDYSLLASCATYLFRPPAFTSRPVTTTFLKISPWLNVPINGSVEEKTTDISDV